MKKLHIYENDKVVEKSTLLGNAKDIKITDERFFRKLDTRIFLLSHLDKIGDDLALRFFIKQDEQLIDFAFVIIQRKEIIDCEDEDLIKTLSQQKDNRLYFKEEDGNWTLIDGDYDLYPFEEMYSPYRHEKLKGVNVNLEQIMDIVIEEFGQKDAINSLEYDSSDFKHASLLVFDDYTDDIIPYINAHIKTFFTLKQFRFRRYAREYFALGFKSEMSDFLSTERLIKIYNGLGYNPNTSFNNVLPEEFTAENIYEMVRQADYEKGGFRSFASAFEIALSNVLIIYGTFANKDTALRLIKEKAVEMLEIGFDFDDFYFHFIADENALLNCLVLEDLQDSNQIDIAINNASRAFISAVKEHKSKRYSSYALELFDYHFFLSEDLPESKNPDILIKKIFPLDLELKMKEIKKTL